MRIDLQAFVEGALHTATGMLQGQMAGQQLAQQQQEAQFNQQLNLAKLMQSGQEQQDANTRAGLPYLEPDSVAGALGTLANRPSPYAGLRSSRLVQGRPDLQAMLPPQPAPQGAPGGMFGAMAGQRIPQPAPLGERQFRGPGGGTLTVKGVAKGEPEALSRAFEGASKAFAEVDLSDDPTLKAQVAQAMVSFPAQIQTPEDAQKAREVIGILRQAQTSLGPRLQALQEKKMQADIQGLQDWRKGEATLNDEQWFNSLGPTLDAERSVSERLTKQKRGNPNVYLQGHEKDITDIQALRESAKTSTDPEFAAEMNAAADMSQKTLRARMTGKLSPRDEATKEATVRKRLDSMNPLRITPKLVRDMYEQAGIGYLVKDLPDKAIRFGDATLYKRLAQAKGQLAQWVNINPAGQKLLLDEIDELQKKLKIDIEVPQEIKAQMTPYQTEQIERQKEESARKDRAETRADWRLWFDWEKTQRDKEIKAGQLTQKEQKALAAVDADVKAAREHLENVATNERIHPSQFTDYDHPTTPGQTKYVAARRAYEAKVEAQRRKRRELGILVPNVQPTPTAPFQTKPVTPKKEEPGLIERGVDAVKGALGITEKSSSTRSEMRATVGDSAWGDREAQRMLSAKQPPPAAALGLVDRAIASKDFEGWVGKIKDPELRKRTWAAYWYRRRGGK